MLTQILCTVQIAKSLGLSVVLCIITIFIKYIILSNSYSINNIDEAIFESLSVKIMWHVLFFIPSYSLVLLIFTVALELLFWWAGVVVFSFFKNCLQLSSEIVFKLSSKIVTRVFFSFFKNFELFRSWFSESRIWHQFCRNICQEKFCTTTRFSLEQNRYISKNGLYIVHTYSTTH